MNAFFRLRLRRVAAMFLCAAVAGCEFGSTTGGSETTNGLTGRIQDGDGKPVAHAKMTLVPADFNPVPGKDPRTLSRTETDTKGRYRFAQVAPGEYDLESRDSARGLRACLPGLRIAADQTAALVANDTVKMTGALRIPFADRHLAENSILYVPGTTIAVSVVGKLDDQGFLTLAGLPEGLYPVLMAHFPDPMDGAPIAVAENFRILSGDTARLAAFSAWSHSRVLLYDLGAAGKAAGEATAARGAAGKAAYPLLVRLRAPEFDFSQARPNGEDFRCERSDGSLPPYQIERWDAAAGAAEIWVRLDSLHAGPDSLILHWGRKDARDMSEGARVFDRANGLLSAWHLGEAAAPFRDATSAAAHASMQVADSGALLPAVTGFGKGFHAAEGGQLTAAFPAAFKGNVAFTATFWMRFDAVTARSGAFSFGEESSLHGVHFLIRPDTSAQFGPWDQTPDALPSDQQNHFSLAPYIGKWIHIATAFDPKAQALRTWVNGELIAESVLPALDIRPTGVRMGKGINQGASTNTENNLQGGLDEVRLYDRALTEAEIKLEYLTQRPDAAITGWR